ncbi:MAG: SDR family oxidoreductase [Candidatus Zixiibacteriota bacterium]
MRYLITGGAGFIGSNLAHTILNNGDDVRILDNFSTGRRENINDIMDKIELIDGDIRDYWTVQEAVKNVDYILHQAALPSVPRSVKNPLTSNAAIVDGTLNLLEASRKSNSIKRFVMASSSSVYGDTPTLPKREDMATDPLSPYAVGKLTCEYYCKVYYNLYGLETVCLRYFNIFGPRQDPGSEYAAVIPKFILSMMHGEKPLVFGDGNQSRDFTFIDNAVKANLLATTAEMAPGKYYNVACGAQFTLNELLDMLREIIGCNIQAEYSQPRPGDILHSYADISRARTEMDYNPKVDFRDGLKKTIKWFMKLETSFTPTGGIKL